MIYTTSSSISRLETVPVATPGSREECKSGWIYKNKLWLFGGFCGSIGYKNDLWSFDVGSNNWAWESGTQLSNDNGTYGIKNMSNPANVPPSRFSYTRWKDSKNNFYLFGGLFNSTYNDVWKYNNDSMLWTWISGSNLIGDTGFSFDYCYPDNRFVPSARLENQTIQSSYTCSNVFWTFGGVSYLDTSEIFYNDLWLFNSNSLEWTKVKGVGGSPATFYFGLKNIIDSKNLPPGRCGPSIWSDYTKDIFIFGGLAKNPEGDYIYFNDMWRFIPDTTCFKIGLTDGVKLYRPNDTTICNGDTLKMQIPRNGSIRVEPNTGYEIDTISRMIKFYGKTNTKYSVVASSFNTYDPCFPRDSVSFTLSRYSLPKADFKINPNIANITNATFNFLNQSTNAIRYEWYYEGQLISSAIDIVKSFNLRGKYCLTLVAINQCGQRDSITKCCEVYERGNIVIPNAFTPNSDNKNDGFKTLLFGPYQKFSLLIMNRYGQEVFKSDNPNELWDGRFNNQEQEMGVYYYLIKVKFDYPNAQDEIYKGDISLLR